MLYVAVQVLTKKESNVALNLVERAKRMGIDIEVIAPGKSIRKYGKDSFGAEHISALPGYIFVGFREWANEIYYLIKGTYGVLKVLLGQKDDLGSYSGIMRESEVRRFLGVESEVALEVTEEHGDMAERLMKQLKKCKEYIERKRKNAVSWITVPLNLVSDLFDNANPEFISNVGGTAFGKLWERMSELLTFQWLQKRAPELLDILKRNNRVPETL